MGEQEISALKDLEIGKRLRTEHAVLRQITSDLAAAVEKASDSNPARWLEDLRTRYERFRAHMTRRIALEEVGGFLKAVEERRPSLASQIEHLRQEHERILGRINVLHHELSQLDPSETAALDDCRLRIRLIQSEVAQHERSENLLVGFVFAQDIGGED